MPVKTALSLLPTGATCAGGGTKTVTRAVVKPGVAGATVTVTVPLWAVPSGVVTENVYEPAGTLPATVSLICRLCAVAPVIVAVMPVWVKLTAVAFFRLSPAIVAVSW